MFGARTGNADSIDFLKGIVADKCTGDLAGEHNQRDGVTVGGGNSCYPVGGTRTGSEDGNSDLACSPCKPVCSMYSSLLMTNKHMFDIGLAEFVIEFNNSTTWIPKD